MVLLSEWADRIYVLDPCPICGTVVDAVGLRLTDADKERWASTPPFGALVATDSVSFLRPCGHELARIFEKYDDSITQVSWECVPD